MTRAAFLLAVVCVLALQQVPVGQLVQIVRAPAFIYDDEQVRIQVRVEPRDGNRLLIVGAWDESGSVVRELRQLEGESDPYQWHFKWAGVPVGELELRAYVFGEGGQRGLARKALIVRPRWVD